MGIVFGNCFGNEQNSPRHLAEEWRIISHHDCSIQTTHKYYAIQLICKVRTSPNEPESSSNQNIHLKPFSFVWRPLVFWSMQPANNQDCECPYLPLKRELIHEFAKKTGYRCVQRIKTAPRCVIQIHTPIIRKTGFLRTYSTLAQPLLQ